MQHWLRASAAVRFVAVAGLLVGSGVFTAGCETIAMGTDQVFIISRSMGKDWKDPSKRTAVYGDGVVLGDESATIIYVPLAPETLPPGLEVGAIDRVYLDLRLQPASVVSGMVRFGVYRIRSDWQHGPDGPGSGRGDGHVSGQLGSGLGLGSSMGLGSGLGASAGARPGAGASQGKAGDEGAGKTVGQSADPVDAVHSHDWLRYQAMRHWPLEVDDTPFYTFSLTNNPTPGRTIGYITLPPQRDTTPIYVRIDLTTLAQDWLHSSPEHPNFGIMIKPLPDQYVASGLTWAEQRDQPPVVVIEPKQQQR